MTEMTYTLEAEHDYYDEIEGSFASDDDDLDRKEVARIKRRYAAGDRWAWCSTRVTVECGSFTGESDWLGGCSYASEKDFKKSDCYKDMQREARENLLNQLMEAHDLYLALLAQENDLLTQEDE